MGSNTTNFDCFLEDSQIRRFRAIAAEKGVKIYCLTEALTLFLVEDRDRSSSGDWDGIFEDRSTKTSKSKFTETIIKISKSLKNRKEKVRKFNFTFTHRTKSKLEDYCRDLNRESDDDKRIFSLKNLAAALIIHFIQTVQNDPNLLNKIINLANLFQKDISHLNEYDKISLENHPTFNLSWVSRMIVDNSSSLELGDLVLQYKETIRYRGAGRESFNEGFPYSETLDLLLHETTANRRFEVGVQLGRVDDARIIRTIEFWDFERRRVPQCDHTAVIIAEKITRRYLNLLSLFNGFIPIVVFQMEALKLNDNISLIFTRIDLPENPRYYFRRREIPKLESRYIHRLKNHLLTDFKGKLTKAAAVGAILGAGIAHGHAVTKKSFPKLTEECIEFINSTDFNSFFNENHKPLNNKKNKVSLNTMHTTLTNQGYGDLLNEILPNYKADKIDYRYFYKIQGFVFKNIKLYVKNSDDDKLIKCFHATQFWGGKMGKSIYVMSDGFNSNFDINDYKRLFSLCAEPNKKEIIKYCKGSRKIKNFGPAFITKHIKFFTKYLHGNKNPHLILPIFDTEICNSMFGSKTLVSYISHYYEYLPRLCKIKKCTPELMENVFFNRANYSTV